MAVSSQTLYLLDTNMIAFIANGHSPAVRQTMHQVARLHAVATSAIAEGETLYGLARRPDSKNLQASVKALLSILDVLPWDSDAARSYGTIRAQLSSVGKTLSLLDMLIAAHAVSINAILVTHDKAFLQVEGLATVDWATDL